MAAMILTLLPATVPVNCFCPPSERPDWLFYPPSGKFFLSSTVFFDLFVTFCNLSLADI